MQDKKGLALVFEVSLSFNGHGGSASLSTRDDLEVADVEEAEVVAAVMQRSKTYRPLYVVVAGEGTVVREWR